MTKRKIYIGIDQSITSTGMTITGEGGYLIRVCKFTTDIDIIKHCRNNNIPFTSTRAFKKGLIDKEGKLSKKRKDLTKEDKALLKVSQHERMKSIISSLIDELKVYDEDEVIVSLENISYGSAGQVSSLAMLLGRLYQAINENLPHALINLVEPSSLKKFATGSGRADKDMIEDAIPEIEKCKIKTLCDFDVDEKTKMDDVYDSYFLAMYSVAKEEDIKENCSLV